MPLLFQYNQTKLFDVLFLQFLVSCFFFFMYFEAGSKMCRCSCFQRRARVKSTEALHYGPVLALRWNHHRHRPHPTQIRGSYLSGRERRTLRSAFQVFTWHLVVLSLGISFHVGRGHGSQGWVIAADVASGSGRTALGRRHVFSRKRRSQRTFLKKSYTMWAVNQGQGWGKSRYLSTKCVKVWVTHGKQAQEGMMSSNVCLARDYQYRVSIFTHNEMWFLQKYMTNAVSQRTNFKYFHILVSLI